MPAVDDVDKLIEQYHLALDEFYKGNPQLVMKRSCSPIEKR
jgi:hypothetical protein